MRRLFTAIILCLLALSTASCQTPTYKSEELHKRTDAKIIAEHTGQNVQDEAAKQQELLPGYTIEMGAKSWGLLDSSGEFVVNPQYEWISEIQEDKVFRVSQGGKMGLLGRSGDIVLSPSYSYIGDFSEGLASANRETGGTSVINSAGEIAFESEYSVGRFHNGLAVISRQEGYRYQYGYIDKEGKTVIEPKYDMAYDFEGERALVKIYEGNYGVIDKTGKILKELNYKELSAVHGGCLVYVDESGFSGYLDYDGNKISNMLFKETGQFVDGYAVVGVASGNGEIKYGVIDGQCSFIIKPMYAGLKYIGEEMFAASEKSHPSSIDIFDRKAIMDVSGKMLTEFKYYDISGFSDGISSVSDGVSTYFIDNKGKAVDSLPKAVGSGIMKIADDIVKAEIDNELYYMTRDGQTIYKPENLTRLNNGAVIKSMKYRPDRGMLIYYPEISGLPVEDGEDHINNELRLRYVGNNPVSNMENGMFLEEINISFTAWDIKDLLILEKGGYYYSIGAAHPMQSEEFLHVNMNTGKFYTLQDLFKKNSDYLKRIGNIISKQIEEKKKDQDAMFFDEPLSDLKPDQQFIICEDGIRIVFQPYEIAPYAAGFQEFTIPYSILDDILDKDGEFWNTFNKSSNI